MSYSSLLLLLPLLLLPLSSSLSCLSFSSSSFLPSSSSTSSLLSSSYTLLLKFPNKTVIHPSETNKYALFDSFMADQGKTSFLLRNLMPDQPNEPLAEILNQANADSDVQVIAWNDEPPAENTNGSFEDLSYDIYSETAHSKGIILVKDGAGVYIIHSTPKYPAIVDSKINVSIARGQNVYGQNFLCLNLDKEGLESLAEGLAITGITVYHNSFTDTSLPNLYKLGQGPAAPEEPASSVIELNVENRKMLGFFKNPYYTSGFIFEDLIIPKIQDNLRVESWGRPYQPSNCSLDIGFTCENINSIAFPNDSKAYWSSADDHSKWAIGTSSLNWVCSGGMNRMYSQAKRGGAFFCWQEPSLWKALDGIVAGSEACGGQFLRE